MREKGYVDGLAFYPTIDRVRRGENLLFPGLAGGQLLTISSYSLRVTLGYSDNNIRY